MAKTQTFGESAASAWYVQQLRLTAFPSPAAEIDHSNWFAAITGTDPETSAVNRKTGEHIDQGLYEDARLILNVQPSRIDWIYGKDLSVEAPKNVTDISLGLYSDVSQTFQLLMANWFDSDISPALIRLAFGAVLLRAAASHEEAYKQLEVYFPFDIPLDGARDFLYRINRPRVSQRSGLEITINRLSTWSAIVTQHALLSFPTLTNISGTSLGLYACRLELDINSDAEYENELEKVQLSKLLTELIELGEEISLKGDIP
jgi:hypothetical protein